MTNQLITAIIFCWLLPVLTIAQFAPTGLPGDIHLEPLYPGGGNDQLSVGIGYFSTIGLAPNAFFHVNSNLIPSLPASGSIATFGETFWTDCPGDAATYWRMLRSGTHYGWLWNNSHDADQNDFSIGSPSGSLLFHTLEGTYSGVTSTMIPHFRISNSDVVSAGNPTFITTASMERLEVTPDVLDGVNALGFGGVLQNPRLLVVGGKTGSSLEPVAEFRSIVENTSSIGIKIRGARHGATKADCAYIDFANYDDAGTGTEYALSRISSDQRSYADHTGYLRIYTMGTGGLYSKFMIDHNGFTGIGYNLFDAGTPPDRRLEVFDASDVQLRLSQTHAANTAASVYSDFQTNSNGNLRINPTGEHTGFNMGAGLNPSNTVEIDADATTNQNYTGGGGGVSGLRFNDLASASTTTTGNGKVLSVDGNGDVVLVNDDNNSEKITALENEVAQLKKQVSELMLTFNATKN